MAGCTMCGVQPHSNENTPHMDRFHSQIFKCLVLKLAKPLEIKREFRVTNMADQEENWR